MDEEDRKMAQGLADGIAWLAKAGREGARLLKPMIKVDEDNMEEAMSWLADIEEGKDF